MDLVEHRSVAEADSSTAIDDTVGQDQRLIRAHLAGDGTAFTAIVDKYRHLVYAVAYRFCNNHEEADDLAQETFVKAFENLDKFRGEAALKTWLLRITKNLSINWTKSGRISKDSGTAAEDVMGGHEAPLLEKIQHDQRKQALYRAIGQLPPKQKQTLLLKTFQDMTCEEVARVMRCSVGTVKANAFNALKKLKIIMDQGAPA
jgi:RNA polymerase sigma-70 factor (ECF subfamily)